MDHPNHRALTCLAIALLFLAAPTWAEQPGHHLFILSGQSNMTVGLKAGFVQTVKMAFGEEDVTVVHHSKSGRGIRFWDKDYTFPDAYRIPGKDVSPSERTKQQHGQEYGPLIEKVQAVFSGTTYDTVTFIWMQGESDGKRGLAPVYAQSFGRLLGRLKKDLNRDDIRFVMGRINDAHMDNPHWTAMREAQVKLAESNDDGVWIDTDDLAERENDVHFPKENYPVLGERFAMKAIELIRERSANDINNQENSK